MTPDQLNWLFRTQAEAAAGGHIFPDMAACEAAEESRFGQSELALKDNNLFGMSAHRRAEADEIVNLPTREFENSEWITVVKPFMKYASLAACFADRMATLSRLASVYPNYGEALNAGDAITYIDAVSRTWSTDPLRAQKVLAIYRPFKAQTQQPTSIQGVP